MLELLKSLGMNPSLGPALGRENITAPTEVQKRVIPEALQNKDLIVQSETGTGKTLAYLLPLFEKLDTSKKEMQALILTPTHELAMQIQKQIERLAQNSGIKVSSAPIIGNVNIDRQIEKLKERPHILVGSPGRILELIKKRKISAHTMKTVILDEADRLLDENNLENIRLIIKSTLKERQLMMFSASITKEAEARGKELVKDPAVIRLEAAAPVPRAIEHLYFMAEQRDKIEVLRKLVRIFNPAKAVVFINKSEENELLTAKLKYHGVKAESIHGANIKLDRKKTMEDFRTGKIQLLIASDIAARGLDIEGITHVFSLNMPEDPKDYLHRAGRTGRKGNSGVAVSIVTERELPLLYACEKALKIEFAQKYMYKGVIHDAKRSREKNETLTDINRQKRRRNNFTGHID